MIHFISDAGRDVLREQNRYNEAFEQFHNEKAGDDKELKHKVAISDTVVDFFVNLGMRGCRFVPRNEMVDLTRREPFTMTVTDKEGVQHKVVPDDMFGIDFADGSRFCVFVEVETGSKDVKPTGNKRKRSTIKTLMRYQLVFAQHAYKQLHSDIASGILCMVLKDKSAIDALCRALPAYITQTRPFLFKHINMLQNQHEVAVFKKEEPEPNGHMLTPWTRCGHPDFDILNP